MLLDVYVALTILEFCMRLSLNAAGSLAKDSFNSVQACTKRTNLHMQLPGQHDDVTRVEISLCHLTQNNQSNSNHKQQLLLEEVESFRVSKSKENNTFL